MRFCGTYINTVVVLTVLSAVTPTPQATADTIIPISQQRSVDSLVNAPLCDGEFFFDHAQAKAFEPFVDVASSIHQCDQASALVAAEQQSFINPNSLEAFGSALSQVSADGPKNGLATHALGSSSFNVTFEVNSTSRFVLDGIISAGNDSPDVQMYLGTQVRLTGPGDETIFDHSLTVNPGDGADSQLLDEVGQLEPGIYTLAAFAFSAVDDPVPPNGDGAAIFNFTFGVLIQGDLNGDGTVGAADLLILLVNWGRCADCDDCNADIDGDCTVGA
ncbi:MAG: hypothetical protein V3T84_05515, partial [Phycisphaerales bacterium]